MPNTIKPAGYPKFAINPHVRDVTAATAECDPTFTLHTIYSVLYAPGATAWVRSTGSRVGFAHYLRTTDLATEPVRNDVHVRCPEFPDYVIVVSPTGDAGVMKVRTIKYDVRAGHALWALQQSRKAAGADRDRRGAYNYDR